MKDLTVEVFHRKAGFNYESVKILDIWKSLILSQYFGSAGKFQASFVLDQEAIELFVPDTILMIAGCYYYVDSIGCEKQESGILKVSGKSLFAKTSQRIIYRIYNQTKRPELVCYDHLKNEVVSPSDTKRRLDYLSVEVPGNITTKNINYQKSYETVEDEIEKICASYEFGFDEIPFSNGNIGSVIRFRKTEDKSKIVEFSAAFENIKEESFERSNYDEKTTALIYGEGDGKNRKHTQVNANLSGIERKELYVDARDLQQTVDEKKMSDTDYISALQSRGKEKLSEHKSTLALNGTVNLTDSLFVYGKDYQIGDRVKRISRFGLSDTAVLTGVIQTWDTKGYHIDGEFGNQSKTIIEVLKRK